MKRIEKEMEAVLEDEKPATIGKKKLMSHIVWKHNLFMETYREEIERFEKEIPDLERKAEELKKKRNDLNAKVGDQKGIRTGLLEEIKELKTEYFELLKNKKFSTADAKELGKYQRQLRDVEWKLETEGIDLETEKRLMEEAKLCFSKIDEINNKLKEKNEREERIIELTRSISEKMVKKNEHHEKMLELVKEADNFHESYIRSRGEARKRKGELERMRRWIAKHEEAIEYWERESKELDREEDQ